MSKSIQFKTKNNEKVYPHPYYPIGSIYLSVNNINPSLWFDGIWELIAKGRTLVGVDPNDSDFNTVQKTGGEKTHKLTASEMPSHSHGGKVKVTGSGAMALDGSSGGGNNFTLPNGMVVTNNASRFLVIENEGGGQAHNNLQPYFTCYIWCRTA